MATATQSVTRDMPQRAAGDLAWYAIQTIPKHERKVASELQRKDLRTFLPLFPVKRQWSDRVRVLDLPLFPGYVFVCMSSAVDQRIAVLRTRGVTSFVGIRGMGIPIPEHQIAAIESIIDRKLHCSPYPFLNVGQRVRIRGGSLEGIEGILAEVKGDLSLVISVELIQRSLAIRVAGYRIEPL